MEKKILGELISIYEVPKAKLSGDGREVMLQIDGKKISGFASSAFSVYEASLKEKDSSGVDIAVLYHWLSFCSTELFHCSNSQDLQQCLEYLNSELLKRLFLCGFTESIADLVMFKALEPFVSSWSYQIKEQYINISRWFSAVQNSIILNGGSSHVRFSKTLLYEDFARLKCC